MWLFLNEQNEKVYEIKGVQWQNPCLNGLIHLDALVAASSSRQGNAADDSVSTAKTSIADSDEYGNELANVARKSSGKSNQNRRKKKKHKEDQINLIEK